MTALLPVFLLLFGCMWGSHLREASAIILVDDNELYCLGGLQVIYPELTVDRCMVVPDDDKKLREKLTTKWKAPIIRYPAAVEGEKYLLMMVDPDAPSHISSTMAHWRHWLVTDVEGSSLKNGDLRGLTITEYAPPTPPRHSGFHRYQFLLFKQSQDVPALGSQTSRGQWDVASFILDHALGSPVASVQFLTQNYQD
ncbi:phosphatidylethanolamine-binding protein 4 [Syngnathus scovelli]|uniref:phosphatidylethanolamine-binding protein 4 n=1 Tax=Syngnathus scovelli TaxID=161590 RepID=UPI002110757B|nr:phosphatidylethanolamine-binding protein 4 [Syngnathus scovelli]